MAITPLPTVPTRNMVNSDFVLAMNNFLAALPQFATDANALAASMSTLAAGGAYAIPYIVDTTSVADSDPGSGKLRFDSSIQSAAITLRLDIAGTNGVDYTTRIDQFDGSTSAIKGQILIAKVSDPTKYIAFNVTGRTAPAGYRNIAVTYVGSSASTPFVNGDSVMLFFQRTGDAGQTGSGSIVLLAQATVSTAVANIDFLNVFTSAYDKYVIEFENIKISAADMPAIQLAVAGAVVSTASYTPLLATGSTISGNSQGGVLLRNSSSANTESNASNNAGYTIEIRNANSTTAWKGIGVRGMFYTGASYESVVGEAAFNTGSALSGFRLYNNAAALFNTATVRVYGIKNT